MDHEEVPILNSENQKDIEMSLQLEENTVLPIAPVSCNSVCCFSQPHIDTVESEKRMKSAIKLCGLIVAVSLVMAIEIVGGVKANSLAVITDAAHLLTDVAGFFISLLAIWASGWESTPYQSFGFQRVEVLGALLSVQLIWLISGILIYQAVDRMLHQTVSVKGALMFATAAFGFIVNLIMVLWLGHDHSHHSHDHAHHACSGRGHHPIHTHEEELQTTKKDEKDMPISSSPIETKTMNINVRGAYLHVMADLIQSTGVMIAGAFIWAKPDWLVVDLICTLVFSSFVLLTTIPMLRDVFSILMQRTPREINLEEMENGLRSIKGVRDVHDLHIWSMTLEKFVLSCHVVAEPGAKSAELIGTIREYCQRAYKIGHVTIQIDP